VTSTASKAVELFAGGDVPFLPDEDVFIRIPDDFVHQGGVLSGQGESDEKQIEEELHGELDTD
jgi:cyclophilin family peptidyl-prolyl cis-trans isomerase